MSLAKDMFVSSVVNVLWVVLARFFRGGERWVNEREGCSWRANVGVG